MDTYSKFGPRRLSNSARAAATSFGSLNSATPVSAKVFAAAARQLTCGTIDAALVGGVDSLCLTTLYGFASLQLTSSTPCRPYDAARNGISIGEGAAFALLERAPEILEPGALLLLGSGESSDAYHMSSPHPEGLGARLAMEAALRSAGLTPADIDYLNLHGTGTALGLDHHGLGAAVAEALAHGAGRNRSRLPGLQAQRCPRTRR